MKQNLLFIIWTFLPLFSIAQTVELTGTVLDTAESIGIPFANIELSSTDPTVLTTKADFDGHFQYKNLESGIYQLKISALGFQTAEIHQLSLKDNSNDIKIELTDYAKNLEPVDIEWKYFTIRDSTGTITCVRKTE